MGTRYIRIHTTTSATVLYKILFTTGGGPPGVWFYHRFINFIDFFFYKVIFEPQQLFFQIRIKKSWNDLPLDIQNC